MLVFAVNSVCARKRMPGRATQESLSVAQASLAAESFNRARKWLKKVPVE